MPLLALLAPLLLASAALVAPAAALSVGASGAEERRPGAKAARRRTLGLSFAQLASTASSASSASSGTASKAAAGVEGEVHKELYKVEVGFNIQEMEPGHGLTVSFDRKKDLMVVHQGIDEAKGLVWGHYDDNIDLTGWSELYIQAADTGAVTNDVTVYAAGFIEGLMTCVRLSEYNANTRQLLIQKDKTAHSLVQVRKLLAKQLKHMKQQTGVMREELAEEPPDAYLKHVRYVLFQLWGICDGYNKAARHFNVHELGLEDMAILNAAGEMPQLMEAFNPENRAARAAAQGTGPSFLQKGRSSSRPHRGNASGEDQLDDLHWERRVAGSGRCSALVRLTPGNTDLLLGHTTWDDYSKMTRIFKYYKLPLDGADTMASHIAMSSYPGVIGSTDDFYLMDSGLSLVETSLIIMNPAAWTAVQDFDSKPHIPNFAHIMAVNRLAKNGAHWAELFMSSNTGTYTSQWLIVDYNQFELQKPLGEGGFWVVEAVPGAMHAADMTGYLKKNGYFPSFNRPFFGPIREKSGHQAAELSHGVLYSWGSNPRAQIFAASAPAVGSAGGMRALMDQNTFPATGFLGASAGHEISARMDLVPGLHIPNGGIDSKVIGRCLQKKMEVQAISGPTHSLQAPFRWEDANGKETFPQWPHVGQPNVWNFGYVQMSPAGQKLVMDEDQFQC